MNPKTIAILAIIFALSVIVMLSIKAFRILSQLKQQNKNTSGSKIQEKADLLMSIQDLAQSMLNNNLNITEGSIRIKVLLDHFDPQKKIRDEFIVFYELYSATEHMPRHKDRDKYTCDDLKIYDDEREKIEKNFQQRIFNACRKISDFEFNL